MFNLIPQRVSLKSELILIISNIVDHGSTIGYVPTIVSFGGRRLKKISKMGSHNFEIAQEKENSQKTVEVAFRSKNPTFVRTRYRYSQFRRE